MSYPGDIHSVGSFESPGPGRYEFLCSQAGHFAMGMYGFIAFGMSLPTNLTLPDWTAVGGHLTFNLVDAEIIAGVVLVLALAGLVWYRRSVARRLLPGSVGHSRPPSRGDW